MYHQGLGVEQDYAKALEWYEKAADAGNASAMYNMATLLFWNAAGGDRREEAFVWYKKAAESGVEIDIFKSGRTPQKIAGDPKGNNAAAVYTVGYMYENGIGTEQDLTEALRWYDAALACATAKSNNLPESIADVIRDHLDKALEEGVFTPEQVKANMKRYKAA